MTSMEAVREAAAASRTARAKLEAAIRRAAKQHSLRAVAAAAELSHEQVRRIAARGR